MFATIIRLMGGTGSDPSYPPSSSNTGPALTYIGTSNVPDSSIVSSGGTTPAPGVGTTVSTIPVSILAAFLVLAAIALFVFMWMAMYDRSMYDFMPAAATGYVAVMSFAIAIGMVLANNVSGYTAVALPLGVACLMGDLTYHIATNTVDSVVRAIDNNKLRRLVIRQLGLRNITFGLLGRGATSFEIELAQVLESRRADKSIKKAVGHGKGGIGSNFGPTTHSPAAAGGHQPPTDLGRWDGSGFTTKP